MRQTRNLGKENEKEKKKLGIYAQRVLKPTKMKEAH